MIQDYPHYHIVHEVQMKRIILPDSYIEHIYRPPALDLDDDAAYMFYVFPLETAYELANSEVADADKRAEVKMLIRKSIQNIKKALRKAKED